MPPILLLIIVIGLIIIFSSCNKIPNNQIVGSIEEITVHTIYPNEYSVSYDRIDTILMVVAQSGEFTIVEDFAKYPVIGETYRAKWEHHAYRNNYLIHKPGCFLIEDKDGKVYEINARVFNGWAKADRESKNVLYRAICRNAQNGNFDFKEKKTKKKEK